MSKHVSVETQIKDKDCLILALNDLGIPFREKNGIITIDKREYNAWTNLIIDTRTGRMTIDDMRINHQKVKAIKQTYAKAKVLKHVNRLGFKQAKQSKAGRTIQLTVRRW